VVGWLSLSSATRGKIWRASQQPEAAFSRSFRPPAATSILALLTLQPLISSATGSQTLKVEGFLGGSSVGFDQYTLANTKVFNPKYDNWTTEAASLLAGKSISELDITLSASVAGSGTLFG
jgi:hypothetical protein